MIGGGAVVVMLLLYTLLFADHRATLNVEKDKITISTVKKGTFDVYIAVTAVVMPLKTIRLDAIEGGYVSRKYLDQKDSQEVMVTRGARHLDESPVFQLVVRRAFGQASVFRLRVGSLEVKRRLGLNTVGDEGHG